MSFDMLTHKELLRTLENDFAFPLTDAEKKTKASTLAAVLEGGLKFSDYLLANPAEADKYVVEPVAPVTGAAVLDELEIADQPENQIANGMVVAPSGGFVQDNRPYLIKMERKNGTYEIGRYVFTREHPFVLVDAHDAQKVLAEGGFRQAFPEEAESYYV